MKKIVLMLMFFGLSNLVANDCSVIFSDLYNSPNQETLFIRASTLKNKCKEQNQKACECYDEFINECEEKCNLGGSLQCYVISTMLGYKHKNFLIYLKKGCNGNNTDEFTSRSCKTYGGYIETEYIKTKDEKLKKEALYYFDKACKMGYEQGCKSYKELK